MAAPKGNQFWKLRLKHGRNRVFNDPDEILENFIEYAQWLTDNPLIETDFRGKDATEVQLPKMRPFIKDGFALACGFSGWEALAKYKSRGEGFNDVITRIENYIFVQKLEGAAAGFLNPNIIARDLCLRDNVSADVTSKGDKINQPSTMKVEIVRPDHEDE